MPFDWKKHLDEILRTGPGPSAPHSSSTPIPEGFDAIKGHHVDFKHADMIDRVSGTLNAVKDSYKANGTTDMKLMHGHDPHLMAQDLAAGVLGEHGVFPKYANGGRHRLHAVDTTPDGSMLRLHYASSDPMEPGHTFSLRPDGSLRYHGRSNHRGGGPYSSPFGLHDKMPHID